MTEQPAVPAELVQETIRVLLVDDQEANLVALEAILAGLDVTLVRATSGEEALWRALAADFAAVLLDVRMPGMSGFAVARLLRSRPRSQMTPILFLTAGDTAEFSLQEGYALGAVDYLVKPLVPEVLRAKVGFFVDYYRQVQKLRSAEQQAQRELHATAERLSLFTDGLKDHALVIADHEGTILEWHGDAELLTGFPATEAVGRSLDILFTADDRATGRLHLEMQEAARRGRVADRRWLVRSDGSRFLADGVLIALHDDAGKLRGFGELFRDATRDEQARKHTERLRALANASRWIGAARDIDSLLRVVTEEGRALVRARRAGTQLAVGVGGPVRSTASSLTSGEAAQTDASLSAHPGLFRAVMAEGRPLRLACAELEARGEWSELRAEAGLRGLLAAPIVGQGGEVLGAVVLSDKLDGEFTEEDEAILVQLARVTDVAVEKLRLVQTTQDADRRRDEFLAILAHELRNPLAPIRSALAVLDNRDVSDATRSQLQGVLTRQVRHLARIADDLLDVARIAGDKLTIRREPVELAHVVALAVESSRQIVEAKRHTLFVDVGSEPIALDADPLRLSQALANILDNAAQYTDEGGRIRLTACRDRDEVVIRIADNGAGIAAEMLPRMFELFTQASPGLARSAGLGVGLTLARKFVELHGGRVAVTSPGPGLGSEFVVRVPAPPRPSAARRVLVVDDNADGLDMVALLLETFGHVVETASDGLQAVDVARAFKPDVMLLDLGLPGRDGYEVARILREEFPKGTLWLVAMSGYGRDEDRQRTREAGFDDHLVKPVEPTTLQEALNGAPWHDPQSR
jgi:PAS domain S-box-containing protein